MRKWYVPALALLMLGLGGCGQMAVTQAPASPPPEVATVEIPQDATWSAAMSSQGRLALSFYDRRKQACIFQLGYGLGGG
jgi:hypothetical protein